MHCQVFPAKWIPDATAMQSKHMQKPENKINSPKPYAKCIVIYPKREGKLLLREKWPKSKCEHHQCTMHDAHLHMQMYLSELWNVNAKKVQFYPLNQLGMVLHLKKNWFSFFSCPSFNSSDTEIQMYSHHTEAHTHTSNFQFKFEIKFSIDSSKTQ